jgi:hypothetical protein
VTETPSTHSEDLPHADPEEAVSGPNPDNGDTRDPGPSRPMDPSDLSPLDVSGPNEDTRDPGDAGDEPPDYR